MTQATIDRPYIQAWLKRVGRQLSGSGRISQIALSLYTKHGGERDDWSRQLRDILTGKQTPGVDLIADIDQLLAKPAPVQKAVDHQGLLF